MNFPRDSVPKATLKELATQIAKRSRDRDVHVILAVDELPPITPDDGETADWSDLCFAAEEGGGGGGNVDVVMALSPLPNPFLSAQPSSIHPVLPPKLPVLARRLGSCHRNSMPIQASSISSWCRVVFKHGTVYKQLRMLLF